MQEKEQLASDQLAYLEPLPAGSMLARIGRPGRRYDEPYEIIVVVAPVEGRWRRFVRRLLSLFGRSAGHTCEIKGLDKRPTVSQWRALDAALHARGCRTMRFDRIDDGVVTRRERQL